jgi:serine/threonine-protein kinase
MAPEQCLPEGGAGVGGPVPARAVGAPADVWGIGVTLLRAAAGERPFPKGEHGSDVPERRWPQLAEEPADLLERAPAAIAEPIMACLAWAPDDRPSPGEVADELELVLQGLPGPRLSRLKPRVRI